MEPRIAVKVKALADRLIVIKGTGQVQPSQRNAIISEADVVVEPLMELLGESLSFYDNNCEKTIFKRLLKEMWKICVTTMEKVVVLPPMTDKAVCGSHLGVQGANIKDSFLTLVYRQIVLNDLLS